MEGAEDLDSDDEAVIAEGRLALGIRSQLDLDNVYKEIMAPVVPIFSGLRCAPFCPLRAVRGFAGPLPCHQCAPATAFIVFFPPAGWLGPPPSPPPPMRLHSPVYCFRLNSEGEFVERKAVRLEAFDKVLLCEPMFSLLRPNPRFEADTHSPGAWAAWMWNHAAPRRAENCGTVQGIPSPCFCWRVHGTP